MTRQVKIANCKTASIRRAPWIPSLDEDVVGEVRNGETVAVNIDDICYDWKDRKFYKVNQGALEGWIFEGVINLNN